MNILLVEDNESIANGLIYAFNKKGYNMTTISSVSETTIYLKENNPDIIILDILLPDGNGFDLYSSVIKYKKIPVIFLTASDEEEMVIKGLNMGAEDYMTKPFSVNELLVRVNKIILRNRRVTFIKVKDICFDIDKMLVSRDGNLIELSSLELKILHLLFMNIGKVVRRTTILDKIWQWTGNDVDDHTVTVYMKRIREKLGIDIIVTIKGIGYRIDEE